MLSAAKEKAIDYYNSKWRQQRNHKLSIESERGQKRTISDENKTFAVS